MITCCANYSQTKHVEVNMYIKCDNVYSMFHALSDNILVCVICLHLFGCYAFVGFTASARTEMISVQKKKKKKNAKF